MSRITPKIIRDLKESNSQAANGFRTLKLPYVELNFDETRGWCVISVAPLLLYKIKEGLNRYNTVTRGQTHT